KATSKPPRRRQKGTEGHQKSPSAAQSPRISPGAFAARSPPPRGRAMTIPPFTMASMAQNGVELPRRGRARPSPSADATYRANVASWCALILEIKSSMDFSVGARGWCYILENRNALRKGDFDVAEKLITDYRKSGDLPLDICAEDDARETIGLEE